MTKPSTPSQPLLFTSLLLFLGMTGTIVVALGFEHIGRYIPCALCLLQRWPYYFAIPIALLATLAAALKAPVWATRSLIGVVAVLMLAGAGLGIYHSGVEWGFWPGPSTCTAPVDSVPTNAGDLLRDLNAVHGPSCTVATFRLLGLSFAGWNVLASLALAGIALRGAIKRS